MGYRRALTLRWSRRDRLAVLVVAVTVAFLTGVTLLGFAMGAQTTTLAEGFGSADTVEQFDSVAAARATASADAAVLPTTTVTVDGVERTVVGVPEAIPEITVQGRSYALPTGTDGVLAAGTQPRTVERTVDTADGPRELRLTSRPGGQVVPERWFVTTPATVDRLGPTGAFVYSPTGVDRDGTNGGAVPLLSALVFFVLATRQLVDLLLLASVAGGVLVAVTAFSVTRVAVEDRRGTISVIRSTGATPGSVYTLFGVRALLLSAVGVALGYALGLVLVRSVVNAAVFAGAPTSLTVSVSADAVRLLAPTSLLLVAVGGIAGVLAAVTAVRPPPAQVLRTDDHPNGDGLLARVEADGFGWLHPTLLDWDALVPSTATLTVFVLFVLLIAAAGGVLAPLTAADEQTITQSEALHPLNSNVPASYAETLQQQGVAASPEILLFGVRDDEPFVARGVDYDAYASLSSTTLVRGRAPAGVDEAVVGADLRRTLGVDVGETMTVGGSTRPAFTRVEVVGVYTGTGVEDDQLLVSLETARALSSRSDGNVHLIRTEPLPTDERTGPTLSVLDAAVDANDTRVRVRLSVQNYGLSPVDEQLTVALGDESRTVPVALDSGRQTRVTVTFQPRAPGTYQLRAGAFDQSVQVGTAGGESGSLTVAVPARIPTGGAPGVTVTRGDRPVSGATVTVVGTPQNATTNDAGVARLPFPTAGRYTVEATAGGSTTRTDVVVADRFERAYTASVSVSPTRPSIATRPVAVATLKNPWTEPVTRTVTLAQDDRVAERQLTLDPGATERLRLRLPFQPAGEYAVSVSQAGDVTAETTYTVQGDERLAAALASSGRQSSGGGIAQAVGIVFGNIRVLLGALVVLVGTMTVGATTASFARSIHAARDEVGVRRAVGAAPTTIFRLVVGDVLRVGGLSTLLSVGLASGIVWLLLNLGELRLFGVALRPSFSPLLLGGAAACALALAVVSACVATVSLVSVSPATLLTPVARRVQPARGRRETGASREEPADD